MFRPGSFNRWFAYGVRNSFGLAFDPVTDHRWDTENGLGVAGLAVRGGRHLHGTQHLVI